MKKSHNNSICKCRLIECLKLYFIANFRAFFRNPGRSSSERCESSTTRSQIQKAVETPDERKYF